MVLKVMEYIDTIFAHDMDYQVYIKLNPTIMGIKFFLKTIVIFQPKNQNCLFLKCKFD
jgi:hypothetical protein